MPARLGRSCRASVVPTGKVGLHLPRSGLVQCRLFRMRNSRHSSATHLLQSGVDINIIRDWLGHVSVDTTNRYARIDMKTKAKALACCALPMRKSQKHWKEDSKLMAFLRGL